VDLNDDQRPDVALALPQSGLILVGLNIGQGRLGPWQSYAAGPSPQSLAAGDADADGIPDLVVASPEESGLRILRGKGDGTIASGGWLPKLDTPPRLVAFADLDGDGKQELLVTQPDASRLGIFASGVTSLAAGRAVVRYGTYPATPFTTSIGVGDVNADGRVEIILSDGVDSSHVKILINQGDGTFPLDPTQNRSYAAGVSAYPCAGVADFNGDGKTDLAAQLTDDLVLLMNQSR
jgi:hypothetical protein